MRGMEAPRASRSTSAETAYPVIRAKWEAVLRCPMSVHAVICVTGALVIQKVRGGLPLSALWAVWCAMDSRQVPLQHLRIHGQLCWVIARPSSRRLDERELVARPTVNLLPSLLRPHRYIHAAYNAQFDQAVARARFKWEVRRQRRVAMRDGERL